MENKNAFVVGLTFLAVVAIFVSAYLYFDNKKLKNNVKELKEDKLKEDKLKLILDTLKRNPHLSDEIKIQLKKQILQFENIDIKISNEIAQALQLFQIGQTENAIEDLVKIIEHLLTVRYENDSDFIDWLKKQKKKMDLHNLLTYCKEEKQISEIEYNFLIAIKTIRNKEDHTIDLKLDNYLNESGLITAIGGINKIASIVYPKKLKENN